MTACGASRTDPCAEVAVPSLERPRIEMADSDVSRSNLAAWVKWLASPELLGRHAGEPGADAAAALLAGQMADLGLTARDGAYCRGFELLDGLDYNVVGYSDTRSLTGDGPVIVVGAHYDGQGVHPSGQIYPGADDNASGVAALLELARLTARRRGEREAAGPRVGWVFVALAGEEVGQQGAHAYLAEAAIDAARVALMVNLDMVGRPWPGDDPAAIGFQAMSASMVEVASLVLRASQRSGVEVRPLAAAGARAPMQVDARVFAESMPTLLLSTALHEDHHQVTDTPERLDDAQVERTVHLVLALADILASHR